MSAVISAVVSAVLLVSTAPPASAGPTVGGAAPIVDLSAVAAHRMCPAPPSGGQMSCYVLWRTDPAPPALASATEAPPGYGPRQLTAAYALPTAAPPSTSPSSTRPPSTGPAGDPAASVTVAVVDAYDDPQAEADLGVYRSRYGLSACTSANGCFRKINQNGVPGPLPPPDTGWAAEISLDVDMVSAVCPSCHILLVEANDTSTASFGAAEVAAANGGPVAISNSYGGPEDGHEAEYDRFYHHPGIAITVSTGDDGYGVSYPASSPEVTAVGGTTLAPSPQPRGWAESAWRGTGAGCSSDEPRPPFQLTVDTGCTRRAIADVAAVADPATGVATYDSFHADGWQVAGGTSGAAPIIAAVYALAGGITPDTSANTVPYAHPQALFDILTGNDGPCPTPRDCTAAPGYDQPTGLGSPNGTTAFTDRSPPNPTPGP